MTPYQEGYKSALDGGYPSDNPYDSETDDHGACRRGFYDAANRIDKGEI